MYDTENKDGGIDYIFEDEKSIIIIQSKYRKAGLGEISYFNGIANKWQHSGSFNEWVDNEVDSIKDKKIYRDVYKKITTKKVIFEFISLDELQPKRKENRVKTIRSGIDQFEMNYVSANELYFYFMLDKIGATYTDPLSVEISESNLNYCDDRKGITTLVCVMKISSLLKELQKLDDIQLVLARNVRVRRESSDVNIEMQKTYLKDSDNFFYGNNGIHFICSEAGISGKKIMLSHPAIINGGQTVRTLFDTDKSPKKAANVLARITKIPMVLQTQKEYKEIIDNIILRSNSNNPMYPWDLRSNDEIQVKIAREMFNRNIYYERKIDEYNQIGYVHALRINQVLDIVDLATIQAVTSDNIGPVKLKKIGDEPLFKLKNAGGYYEQLFNQIPGDYDEVESKISLFHYIKRAKGYLRSILPEDFVSFANAAQNYIIKIVWYAISDHNSPIIHHPIKISYQRYSKLNPLLRDIVRVIFKEFMKSFKENGVEQNDFFRRDDCWSKVENAVFTSTRIKDIKQAIIDEQKKQSRK